jgi:hypothetical protein
MQTTACDTAVGGANLPQLLQLAFKNMIFMSPLWNQKVLQDD